MNMSSFATLILRPADSSPPLQGLALTHSTARTMLTPPPRLNENGKVRQRYGHATGRHRLPR